MASFSTTVQPFDAALGANVTVAGLNANTFALSAIGDPVPAVFDDADGVLGPSDNGITTFNGEPVTFIGSGTIQFGVAIDGGGGGLLGGIGSILGGITNTVFDVLSDPADVTVFAAGGQVYLILPDGPPDTLLGLDSLLVRFSLTDTPATIPCFASGTLISTPDGDIPIEDLVAGQMVLDTGGVAHRILWIGARNVSLLVPRPDVQVLRPVRIRANAFGAGRPYIDLVVSQQHKIAIEDPRLELVIGESRALCAAKHLVGDLAFIDRQIRNITYHHILCEDHVVLVANGMPAESLFLGATILAQGLDPKVLQEIEALFPERLAGELPSMEPALPVLRKQELLAALT